MINILIFSVYLDAQALEFRRTGKLPDSFVVDTVEEEEPKTPPKKSNGNGLQT